MEAKEVKALQQVRVLPGARSDRISGFVPPGVYAVSEREPVIDEDGDVEIVDESGDVRYVLPEFLEPLLPAGSIRSVGETIELPPCPPPGTVLQAHGGSTIFVVLEGDGDLYLEATGCDGGFDWHAVLVNGGPLHVIGTVVPL